MGLEVKDRDIVVPGETLATGMDFLPGAWTYRNGEVILAARLGLVHIDGRAVKLIPLSGRYSPKRGDTIIGKVEDITLNGWRISLNSAYTGMLGLKDATSEFVARGADLTRYFDLEDYVVCKIINVTSQKLVDMTMKGLGLKKLGPGRIMTVNTNKVPRIIGKQNSMVAMVREHTHSDIVVGQNGLIWIHGDDMKGELLAVRTIRMIEEEAHMSGLTDRVQRFLKEEAEKLGLPPAAPRKSEEEFGDNGHRGFDRGGYGGERGGYGGGDRGGYGGGDRGGGYDRGPRRHYGGGGGRREFRR